MLSTATSRDQNGQAMVEFALVLPIMMLILVSILQFGLMFYTYIDLTSADREGARKASVDRTGADPVTDVKTAIANATSVVTDSKTTVSVTPAPPWTSGQTVDVKVTYPYTLNVMGVTLWGGPMTADEEVRIE